MNQPLGFAIGNALEVMEVSQTLQNAGPVDLTQLSLELAARMIHLGKVAATLEEAREIAQAKLLDGSGYRKLKEVIGAQGGNPSVLDRFELLPNATGAREIASPRAGYVSAIEAEYIGLASAMIGAGRDTKEDSIDPAVGVILEVKIGQKVDAGAVLCRLYYTSEERVEEASNGRGCIPHCFNPAGRSSVDSRSRGLNENSLTAPWGRGSAPGREPISEPRPQGADLRLRPGGGRFRMSLQIQWNDSPAF
jgi:hypothetical protein